MNLGQRGVGTGDAGGLIDCGDGVGIVHQIGQARRNRLHVGVELPEIGRVESADGEIGRGVEDSAYLRKRRVGAGRGCK